MNSQSPLLGFNNNVKHRGRLFHIQTEDSGLKHPHVITHLFADGGRILKTLKTSYAEHVGSDTLPQTVRELMKHQHKTMFIALRDGEFDHLFPEDAVQPVTAPPNALGTSAIPISCPPRSLPGSSGTVRGPGAATSSSVTPLPRPTRPTARPPVSAVPPAVVTISVAAGAGVPAGATESASPVAASPVPAGLASATLASASPVPAGLASASPVPAGLASASPVPAGLASASPVPAGLASATLASATLASATLAAEPLPVGMPLPAGMPPPAARSAQAPIPTPSPSAAVSVSPRRERGAGAGSRTRGEAPDPFAPPPPPGLALDLSALDRARAAEERKEQSLTPSTSSVERPSSGGRYAASRPAAVFATACPDAGGSIFGDDLVSEKSLDEVILSYLSDDLETPSSKK